MPGSTRIQRRQSEILQKLSELVAKSEVSENETREGRQWSDMLPGFDARQVAALTKEGGRFTGRTAEAVEGLRSQDNPLHLPVPPAAVEMRARETVASGTADPVATRLVVDRLLAGSVAARMGGEVISIPSGQAEWPVATSAVSASRPDGERAEVGGPTACATTDRAMRPPVRSGFSSGRRR